MQGCWGCLVLRFLGTQAPLDAVKKLRMEWGPAGWIKPGADGEKRVDLQLDSTGIESLAWLGGHGSRHREAFYGRLDTNSLSKNFLHCSPGQITMKRGSPWF